MTGAELIKAIEEHNLKDAKLDAHATMDGEIVFLERDAEHDIYKETTIDMISGSVVEMTYF